VFWVVVGSKASAFTVVKHCGRYTAIVKTVCCVNAVEQLLHVVQAEMVRHGDGAGNTVEENSGIFSLIRMW